MIGSLLFYALYPLSWYLSRRCTGQSEKDLSPKLINGRTEWDGGTATIINSQSETALLDQIRETMGDEKERVEEPDLKDNNTNLDMDKEPLTVFLHKETKNDTAPKMREMQSALKEEVETPKHKNSDDINPQQALMEQFKCLQIEDSIQEVTCPKQKQTQTETLDVSVLEAEESKHICSADEQVLSSDLDESKSPAKTTSEVTECWDEYLAPTGDVTFNAAGDSEIVYTDSFLSSTQTHPNLDEQHDAQTGWHFPAGPGLAQEVQCPFWQLPAGSYYPPMEPTVPLEVWRIWEDLDQSAAAAECALTPFPSKSASMDFTVMSYNILAQDLLELNEHLYIHCPLEVLDWNYRCSLLLKEINNWTPDILCLQEVQENHYHEQLYPFLSQLGYTCVYKRRTGTKTDGCAICYRSTCFAEVAVSKLEFFRPETELLDRHNVGIVLLLQPLVGQGAGVKEMGPPLCVANTHLLFNPRRGDVKLAQLAIMVAEIDTMIKSCKAKGQHCNVVLCGDFNSRPHTPLYQLITTGKLYYQGLPAWMISGQEDLSYKPAYHRLCAPLWPSSLGITDRCQYITSTTSSTFESKHQKAGEHQYSHEFMLQLRFCPAACVRPKDLKLIPGVTDNTPDASADKQQDVNRFRHSISHRLDLKSVYKHVLPGSGCPEVTTLHSEGGATVDYIFYTPKHLFASEHKACGRFAGEGLKLTGFLSLLSEDVLWSMNGLPNHIFPSDHLCLVAQFQLDLSSA
ncbi:protein angel homolog 1 isoform X2 [Kryptolebias marmoratus]|uniref:protein angel homolog 1 isoform X2 n=1 Tax=Kryptolebias marmoratus TaxID=37003 RepID=UPI000D52F623|nr:protein angel homolog 1 isoform X2 [Kryptolebias marmoratus]